PYLRQNFLLFRLFSVQFSKVFSAALGPPPCDSLLRLPQGLICVKPKNANLLNFFTQLHFSPFAAKLYAL
ncbi:hypothetical protein, partial [Luoshenia tenuis]|uniref:hypothetical protein n=1 Tax=Luoshenia tenuis TaxID=2763654 RepID=UPI0020162529